MSTCTKTVAVVDDDSSMLVGVERLLNAYGYATKVFPSAEAFLAPGAETDADCLLLDVDLERHVGYRAAASPGLHAVAPFRSSS